ncbi:MULTISPECIES: N-acetylmuramic acid 6-phosphate etherase [Paenibacillus]|uniref:N-acetylmuramic acid 6-phosphate etherase n=1 Tax=Paenibacillus TaxID=44249 RepID=UPI000CFA7B56|nr:MULTISPECIES: N-acetylmuramic acid 6-phosphate etherase [Paenibacillus]MBJ9988638.1 N-acetylmuramic acid 6-phosphate etherase [Paenibacillus sp. S28]MEC0178538.1 N-acetylmuramic acid 6-phosphate etherase [Paenibacillus favisporus]PQP90433.1 N-acetylmuramic acid 6-phosphate etherase [Paenibacillus sp. AR247]GIO59168.1 N-acetylmuramic acid 6-phosphate etherase [Paenibacillus cineris]
MDEYLAGLTTEGINDKTLSIDECSTEEMVRLMNEQDSKVPAAVAAEIPQIVRAVDTLHHVLKNGGRMFYVGAGSSGRLGVLDASECPPTFGVDPLLVQGHIAGGDGALRTAVEGYEDNAEEGVALIERCGVTDKDAVIGISASGSATFVIAALKKAGEIGAATIGVVNNKNSKVEHVCDVCIAPVVGPEVIMGSTRLKAGTAQKMVLNMLTTCTMVKLGKTYNNLMVDLKASNIKLRDRSVRIIKTATGVDDKTALSYLESASMNCKLAIMMIKTGLDAQAAEQALDQAEGSLKRAIRNFSKVV